MLIVGPLATAAVIDEDINNNEDDDNNDRRHGGGVSCPPPPVRPIPLDAARRCPVPPDVARHCQCHQLPLTAVARGHLGHGRTCDGGGRAAPLYSFVRF